MLTVELHYLQMACEKIAKAYRCRDTDADLEDLLKRHIGFAKFMSSFLASPGIQEAYKGRSAQLREISRLSLLTSAGGRTLLKLVDRAIQDFES